MLFTWKNQSILIHIVNQKFTAKYVSNVAYLHWCIKFKKCKKIWSPNNTQIIIIFLHNIVLTINWIKYFFYYSLLGDINFKNTFQVIFDIVGKIRFSKKSVLLHQTSVTCCHHKYINKNLGYNRVSSPSILTPWFLATGKN